MSDQIEKKYQIFISSTYEDLKRERQKVIETILKLNDFPIGMEMFNAESQEQWEVIERTIKSSDYYILIVKKRYGSISKIDKISYTEKEYNFAKKIGIPVLVFLIGEHAPVESSSIEKGRKSTRLEKFVERLKNDGNTVEFWNNAEDLSSKVSLSLTNAFKNNPRLGWIPSSVELETKDTKVFSSGELDEYIDVFTKEKVKRLNNFDMLFDAYQSITNRLFDYIQFGAILNRFERSINIEIKNDGESLTVLTNSNYTYINIPKNTPFFSTTPVFISKEQANSYKITSLIIDGRELSDKIKLDVQNYPNKPFPYKVVNNICSFLPKDKSECDISISTKYECSVNDFFQSNQLIYPCRDYQVTIALSNNQNHKYRIEVCLMAFYNTFNRQGHTARELTQLGDLVLIHTPEWMLPGAGYAFTIASNSST